MVLREREEEKMNSGICYFFEFSGFLKKRD